MSNGIEKIKELNQRIENSKCADCLASNPQWSSSTLGSFICIKCSGIHRSLGTHITLVRSCTLDSWTPSQLKIMESVGNEILNEYWEKKLPLNFIRPNHSDPIGIKRFIEQKYVEKRFIDENSIPPHLKISQNNTKSNPNLLEINKTNQTMIRSQSSQPLKEKHDVDDSLNNITPN